MKRSLRSWLWRVPLDQEVDEELAFHIEMRTRELVERGMDPKVAREIVLSRIGDLGQLKRTCEDLGRKRDREMRLTQWLEDLRDDVSVALRQLKASPGIRPRRRADARARHRRQQRDVRRRRRDAAASAAVSASRSPDGGVGDRTERTPRRRQSARLRRLDRARPHLRRDGRRDERSSIDHRRRRDRPTAGDTSRHGPVLRRAWRRDRSSAAHSSPATRDQDPMSSCCPRDSGEATSAQTRHWWAAAPAWAGER